ncbi:glycosyltransferase family 4 protein [Marisediminicola antarctica]|uniref:Glycosyltransferase n=1 Tax=Marisediminicola antarctica TaxID=674079 RepID=A0A7L5AJN7_9MICO|nr:glycosyltransferase family 4 protein [Marisediminicola antarctica]QHO70830.1 hypothetical protein BHD05_15435 [Marisediminicola antarctica]
MKVVSILAGWKQRWPKPVARAVDRVLALVPESVAQRVNPAKYGFAPADVPAPPTVPVATTRLYIAPVNFAAQGFAWARAAELLPDVGAVSMQYRGDPDYGFPSDNAVPVRVFRKSRSWQRAQFAAVAGGFTHVLYEAERPIFGELFDLSPAKEIAALRARGVNVAMVSHGSDLRLPSRHRAIDEWSPFRDSDWGVIPTLEAQALDHRRLLAEIGARVYLSTPDLLLDWPDGHWLPVVVDGSKWWCDEMPLVHARPRVVHAPSSSIVKGSDLIEPAMTRLHDEGVIEYQRARGVAAREMPALYRGADIVLDQFRIGTYGTAAIESMAAGRVVVGHVHDQVRHHVAREFGVEVPVVQATVATLEAAIRRIATEREHYREVAADGVTFARLVHDGRASADALRPFLLSD